MRTLALLLALPACTGPTASPTCTDADGLDAGAVVATVDGAAWATTATWLWQGESLQVTASPAEGWRFTLVGQTTADGSTVKAAADAGAFPIDIALDSGGWALVYPEDGRSYDTRNGSGGTLTVTEVGEDLYACFGFGAATEGGEAVEMTDGALRAVPF